MTVSYKKDVKETIIKVAQKTFAKFGFWKTSMQEIADAVHMSKSALYHYFKSKEEIFKIIIERESVIAKKELTNVLANITDPKEKFRTYLIERMKIIYKFTNLYNMLEDTNFEHYKFIDDLQKKAEKEKIEHMKKIIDDGIKQKVFKKLDTNSLVPLIIMSSKGIEEQWVRTMNFNIVEKQINELTNYFFYGIVKD